MSYQDDAKLVEISTGDVPLTYGEKATSTLLQFHHFKGTLISISSNDITDQIQKGNNDYSLITLSHHRKGILIELESF